MKKPPQIIAIEKELDIELDELIAGDVFNIRSRNTYQLNAKGEVLGLNLRENEIVDISCLQGLNKLTALDLSDNQLTDFSLLKELKGLKNLYLSSNNITEISFLKELKGLTNLDLSSNQITDISFLKDIKGLTTLDLSFNNITDYSFLKDIEGLTTLDLSFNEIRDYSFLKNIIRLTDLDLSNNQITDISFLKDLKGLTNLDLSGNEITDISFLQDLIGLTDLYLNDNQITDISFLQDLIGLTDLYLNDNQITDISFLKHLKGLTVLYLKDNQITDISFLQNLKELTDLDLSNNQITDISFLKDLTGLTDLNLTDNQITDISFLQNLKELTELDLKDNQITDISFLKDLKELTDLDLSYNQITDYSFLNELTGLTNLYLYNNQITDISFLKHLKGLTVLYLSNNQITDISFLKDLKGLTLLDLNDNQITDIQSIKELIFSCEKLRAIVLEENRLALPSNILNDLEALRAYFKDNEQGTTDNRNIKLLFLGDGCVGKSTLLSHLKSEKPPLPIGINERTEGIALTIWQEILPTVKVNVWDFGGQEILHSTHRLFLGEQAIYVLVWCNEKKKKCGETETHNLKYWLDFIADYGNESIVLLVENVIEDDFDNSEFPDDVALAQLVKEYKERKIELITTQYRFDCQNNTDEVINFKDTIKNKIKSLLKKYPITDYPHNWYLLQERLEQEKISHKTISMEKYLGIANELSISDPKSLIRYFCKIGVLGYYEEFSKDKIILQLDWVLDAIYAGLKLKDNPLARTKGKLMESDFDTIWKDYTEEDKNIFKTYMLKSNLLAYIDSGLKRTYQYLCPALFENKSIDSIRWEEKESYVVLQFNFVFGAIMQQLQVRVLNHCNYEEEEVFYKNYICFKDKYNRMVWVEMVQKEMRIYCENDKTIQTVLNEVNKIYPIERIKLYKRTGSNEEIYQFLENDKELFDTKIMEVNKHNDMEVKKTEELKVFVTYSWTDENGKFDETHQNKVGKFVTELRTKWGVEASLDLYKEENNFIEMMYKNLIHNDKIIIVLSKGYKKKADDFQKSGVATEYVRIISDISEKPSKYILVSFDGRDNSKIPFGFKGNDVVLINGDLERENLPDEQNRLVSKLRDELIVDIPKLDGKLPDVKKKSFK